MNVNEENSINLKAIDGIFQASNWNIEPTITILGVTYTASEFNKAVEMLKQPQLNENQQIVLDFLKEYMLDDSDFYNTIYALKYLYSAGEPYGKEGKAFKKLKDKELAQVLELFSKWAQEQEEEK